ncbi:MAG: cytochrome c3 family protein [Ignavibacteria bacterium]|jgi:hypothetical protein
MKIIYKLLFTATVLFLAVTAFTTSENGKNERTNKDIIKFSHQLHTADIECADCHSGVNESVSLDDRLLPVKDFCAECHDVEDDEACETCHYEDVFEPLLQKKSELIFNHSIHLTNDLVECTACHIGFEEIDYSSESEFAFPPMSNCFECHNGTSLASNDCELCHKSTVGLIPENHMSADFIKHHQFMVEVDENCVMCHDDNFCGQCHVGTTALDVTNSATDFYTPYSPHDYVDNTKQQQINLVHDLNYRFTHGIDAKGKTLECESCHSVESFCAECHNVNGGDFAIGGFVPYSHTQSNFTTIGRGTGGGLHAILAKRDIESCAACHDTQGADANCILCHSDPDGIKGTNPRTHESGFMSDDKGDFHSDNGAICYTCHTSSTASTGIAGQGFCGYCHSIK